MSFNILAKHYKWGTRSVSGVDYLTFELINDDGTNYSIFLSASIKAYIMGTKTDYDLI